jgi:hypothetical protein
MEPPRVMPVPRKEPPPETEPRQDSMPAAARPGANTDGTVETEEWPWVVMVLVVLAGTVEMIAAVGLLVMVAVPPVALPPPIAVEELLEREAAIPVPIAMAVASPARAGEAIRVIKAVVARRCFMVGSCL